MQVVSTPTAPAATGLRRVLVVLCVTEITSWGILFYAFPVLLGSIATDTGWSATALTGVFSAGQLLTALTGVLVGRRLDHHGPRTVMTAGSALAVTALIIVATAQTLTAFLLGWALAGISMGAVLYPPAFAALTRWYGPDRVRALTVLTLAGGLASTVFAPLTAALATRFDWRATYLILAAILAVVTIPGHWFGLRSAWPPRPEENAEHAHLDNPGSIARSRAFICLAIALSVAGFASFAVVVTLVPLMTERGISTTTAAVALGLGGLGQVVSRIGYRAFADRTSVRTRTAVILVAIAATTMLLGIFTTAAALTVAAILSGMARGVFTLLQATAITDRWGSAHYGRLTGLVSAPMTTTVASAPFVATALAANLGGYPATFLILGTAAALAAALSLTTIPKY
ncbi:MFS transporter [Nocardia puris]|uniref:Putative MFS family arabinose efflux permease n=1 Tax=Nocardia puris TaxID=208602 RepID=A0A366CXC1_9NOCA|nr:MFS transporter [Nocardia puris]RBO82463.1 putative MFS family arabinose efflux permease [Nocardia puris]